MYWLVISYIFESWKLVMFSGMVKILVNLNSFKYVNIQNIVE